jgi:hypothetical protein
MLQPAEQTEIGKRAVDISVQAVQLRFRPFRHISVMAFNRNVCCHHVLLHRRCVAAAPLAFFCVYTHFDSEYGGSSAMQNRAVKALRRRKEK